jgi:hypothetical protein
MVEEVGDLELEEGLPEGKLQEPFYDVRTREMRVGLNGFWIPKMGALATLI